MCYFPGGFIFSHGACSIDDCKAAPLGVSVPVPPKPIEERKNSVHVFFGGIVKKIKEILKKWFGNVLRYFNDMLNLVFETAEQLFGWFKQEGIQQDVFSHLTVTKWAALFLLSSFTFSRLSGAVFSGGGAKRFRISQKTPTNALTRIGNSCLTTSNSKLVGLSGALKKIL